jgi:hypothetical protein
VRLEELGQLKKIHFIGTRTRDLSACSIVPQPTTLPSQIECIMRSAGRKRIKKFNLKKKLISATLEGTTATEIINLEIVSCLHQLGSMSFHCTPALRVIGTKKNFFLRYLHSDDRRVENFFYVRFIKFCFIFRLFLSKPTSSIILICYVIFIH